MRTYLDYQATTPIDEVVLEAMLPWMRRPANPHASEHDWGRSAEQAVAGARLQVAAAVNADPESIIFTSGATEAANIVLRSFAGPGRALLISSIEHPAVADTATAVEASGTRVDLVTVGEDGLVNLDSFPGELEAYDLVSIMAVNNEVGTIQPIEAIAILCRAAEVPFHTDAAQALGRVPIDLTGGISFATISGHKIYGPQGIGAVCAGPGWRSRLEPMLSGGGQQGGLRPGTTPVALCVGLGKACELAVSRLEEDSRHCSSLAASFLEALGRATSDFAINGSDDERVPHNLNVRFSGIVADELLAMLPDLALSTGSACSSGAIAPSKVLTAMGLEEDAVRGSVRIGFGRPTTTEEVVDAAQAIGAAVNQLRGK